TPASRCQSDFGMSAILARVSRVSSRGALSDMVGFRSFTNTFYHTPEPAIRSLLVLLPTLVAALLHFFLPLAHAFFLFGLPFVMDLRPDLALFLVQFQAIGHFCPVLFAFGLALCTVKGVFAFTEDLAQFLFVPLAVLVVFTVPFRQNSRARGHQA